MLDSDKLHNLVKKAIADGFFCLFTIDALYQINVKL